jgi:hypothetical protein
MSHCSVLVIGDNPERQLAPYQENNMGDCPKEYLEFNSINLEEEGYKTIEEAEEDGYKIHNGEVGYWENPNRKWDWYVLGGRWANMLRLKNGEYGDIATIDNVDLQSMRDEAADEARKEYDCLVRLCGGSIPKLDFTWEEVLKLEDMSIEDKRKIYHSQPAMVTLRNAEKEASATASKKDQDFIFQIYFNGIEAFQCAREEYIQNARNHTLVTFAVLKDGEWYERGNMGWFGCVVDEKDKADWLTEFNKLLDNLSPDTLISIYDCHI